MPSTYIASKLKPDVYFLPERVWEISFDAFTISSVYQLENNLGLSLRFPCFNRVRSDKSIRESTSSEEIANMYNRFAELAEGQNQ
jgi:DNA ligase-1